jgi:hypothetical protein
MPRTLVAVTTTIDGMAAVPKQFWGPLEDYICEKRTGSVTFHFQSGVMQRIERKTYDNPDEYLRRVENVPIIQG